MAPTTFTGWTSVVTKAAFTLLLVAVVASVAWSFIKPVVPLLLVLLALIAVYRIAIGWFRRDGW